LADYYVVPPGVIVRAHACFLVEEKGQLVAV
jgi:hypothetical protein